VYRQLLAPARLVRPAVGLALLTPLLLTAGCQKPVPGVTLVAGGKAVRTEAACWSFKASTPANQSACSAGSATKVKVRPNVTVGISVDKAIRQAGWRVTIGPNGQTQQLTPTTITDSYYRFPIGTGLGNQTVPLTVIALDKSGQALRGVWKFELDPGA
jgi:hypothetical protein